MKMKAKRLISLILALVLAVSGLSIVSFAEDVTEMPAEPDTQSEPSVEEALPEEGPEVTEDQSVETESEPVEEPPAVEEPVEETFETLPEEQAEEPDEMIPEEIPDADEKVPVSEEYDAETEAIESEETTVEEVESDFNESEGNDLEEEPEPTVLTLREAISSKGFAYVETFRNADVFSDSDMTNLVYTMEGRGNIVFATFCGKNGAVLVSFAISDEESITGYVSEDNLEGYPLSDKDVDALTRVIPNMEDFSPIGISVMFLVKGHRAEIEAVEEVPQPKEAEDPVDTEIVEEPDESDSTENSDVIPEIEDEPEAVDPADTEIAEEQIDKEESESEPVVEIDEPLVSEEIVEDEANNDVSDAEPIIDEPVDDIPEIEPTDEEPEEPIVPEEIMEDEVGDDVSDAEPINDEPANEESEETVPDEDLAEPEPIEEEPVEDDPVEEEPVEDNPTVEIETEENLSETEPEQHHAAGDFVSVTTRTRVYFGVDNSITEGDDGVNYLGVFTKNAVVQIVDVSQDDFGKTWYKVNYLYGDTLASGKTKWTAYGIVYVLESETQDTDSTTCTVTDWAYTNDDLYRINRSMLRFTATPKDGFSLKNISVTLPKFKAGQTGKYGSSGKDSAYPQLAKSAAHGTIYATPHYLEGYQVYCLEHTYDGPGEGSGSNQSPTGPYVLVDMDGFCNTDAGKGVSGVRYKESTMHAIGWVLRHTYPFMVLKRSDEHNEEWSRVAGQFAIREVIKQLEGAKYVRDYWDMDNFYSFSGGAPSVYLTYARWLAENGIARASITGKITASKQSMTLSGSNYVGTVTLKTDADLIRIPKSVGTLTGNSGGSDSNYYYLKSGDTISITSTKSKFTVNMESISSEDEEANFLIGIPSVKIQKVLIPIEGTPNVLKSASLTFELTEGEIAVVKKSSDGILLKGAVFELLNSAGTVVKTETTDTQGKVTFYNLVPGSYKVREKTAPEGYSLSATATQNVTVTAGATTNVTFTNERITGVIKIVKKDSSTNQPLPGATFTVTRLSGPASDNASDIGKVVATIKTNAQGIAQTGLLPWGQYKIQETGVPDGYLDPGYSTTVTIK